MYVLLKIIHVCVALRLSNLSLFGQPFLHTGYPIVNDPLYASRAWGEQGGKGGVSRDTFEKAAAILINIMDAPPLPPIMAPQPQYVVRVCVAAIDGR